MAERSIGTNTRKRLINNEPFAYAHLVKFERPSSSIQAGKVSTDAKRYAYFTDATHNLSFDDQSYNTLGTSANGAQTYIAGKLLQVGSYSETIEARASGMTLVLAAESLNNAITSSAITMTASTITVPAGTDLVKEGFREGDKIFISGGTNNNKYVNVTGIKTNNTVLTVTNIDHTLATQNTGTAITLSIVSDELQGPLGETNLSTVKSYANRDVWVYKAFLNPETGEILDNNPVLIFKGIITKADIDENPGASVRAKWSLTSHWGDFAQVTGRATNDAIHRALDNNNRGQIESALRPEYANDLGFLHAEETINVLANYTTIETETIYRNHKSWFGARNKMKSYTVDHEISNDVRLDFALSSKFLPVVYGVQRVDAIPFFVDTKEDDANNIFIAYALCEGEIGGLYDLYIENNPLMCINAEDAVSRDGGGGSETAQAEVHCRGRADRGNTLGGVKTSGTNVSGSAAANYAYGNPYTGYSEGGYQYEEDYIEADLPRYQGNNTSLRNTTLSTTDGTGVQHEETISLTAPNTMSLTFHAGKPDQRANNQLVEIASASAGSKFKRQADYYTGEQDYWGPNHRVLDTAYVVMDCEIGEDATTVPEVEYVVRGKLCSSYNYDYSYAHTPTVSGEDHTNFKVGDKVVLHNSTGDAVINSSVQIIDKWSFVDPDGTVQYRFRFSSAPTLGYSDGYATIKQFYMKNSSNQTWTMSTWDWQLAASGTVPELLDETVTINNNGTSPATITIPNNTDWIQDVAGDPDFPDYHGIKIANSSYAYGYRTLWFTQTNTTTLTHAGTGGNSTGLTAGSHTIISATGIKLASNSSTTDDYYNGYEIELKKSTTGADGSVQIASYKRRIVDYDGGTKIATVNQPWLPNAEPAGSDTYSINGKTDANRTDDKRVSINPAIQLTDYLTGGYGKNLDLEKDISLADFLLAARTCDDRGTQTLQGAQAGSVGDRYVLTSDGTTSGTVVAMGLVKSLGTSNSINYTEFEEVSNKFTHKFMGGSYSYSIGEIVYNGTGYYRAGSAGIETKEPAGTSNISAGSNGYVLSWTYLTSVPLFAISNTGTISGSAVNFTRSANSVYYNPCATYNSALETYETGYSLYDSDHVKYWRYLGWDSQHQRFATRHQTQGTVSTSDSVFANVNGFLQQFNGLLSYEGGKYALRIETTSDAITSTIINASNTGSYSGYTKGVQHNPRIITDDDIIGNLSIKDKGTAKSFNTVSASIMDPANLFKGRSVSFYDSNYLKADKNIVKSGNISISSIGNYYNARINVENFLRKSRFGLDISFRIGPKSLMLLAGDTIAITNEKFGFTEKKFRITNINYSQDCTAQITAEEYDDSFYTISSPTLSSVKSDDQRLGLQASPPAPQSLANPVVGALGELTLNWVNGTALTPNCFTEVWAHTSSLNNNQILSTASLLTRVAGKATSFAHTLGGKDVTRYYWIRSGKAVTLSSGGQNKTKELFSAFVGPVNATTTAPVSAYGIVLGGPTSFVVDAAGSATPTTLNITADRTNLSGNITWTAVEEGGSSITLTNTSNTNATLTYSNFGASNLYVTVTATVTSTTLERAAGAEDTYTSNWTVSKVSDGAAGSDAKTVKLTVDDYSIQYAADGTTPSPSGNMTLTATSQNFTDAYFKFTGDGISDETSYSDGSGANADTFTFTIPTSHFTTPKSLKVSVQEGNSGGEVAFDTITITAVKPGAASTVAGAAAKVVVVTPSNQYMSKFYEPEVEGDFFIPASITIKAATTNTTTNGAWSTSAGTLTSIDNAHAAPSCVVTSGNFVDGMTVTYTLAGADGGTADSTTLELLEFQSSAITAILSNEAHVFPASVTGNIDNSDYGGSGTTIKLFQGVHQLDFDGSGSTAGHFNVAVGNTANITEGGVSSGGSGTTRHAIIGSHSAAADGTDTYVINYTISGKDAKGDAFSFVKTQSLSKSKTGTAGAAGTDGMTFVNSNEAHVFPASSAGVVSSYSGSGTTLEVFEGATALSYDGTGTSNSTWKVTAVGTNITVGNFTDNGATVTVGADGGTKHSGVADNTDVSKIVYTITGKRADGTAFSATVQQSFTKSKGGATGSPGGTGAAGTSVKVFYASNASGANESTSPGSLEFIKYVEYTGTAPTTGGNSGFVRFVGEDGSPGNPGTPAVNEGVIAVYASNATGSGKSLSPGSLEFINFLEWSGTAPANVSDSRVANLTSFVKFIGDDADVTANNIATALGFTPTNPSTLVWSSPTVTSGAIITSWTTEDQSAFTPSGTTQAGTLTVSFPTSTYASQSVTFTWTRTALNISGFALTNDGTGIDEWDWGSNTGGTDESFGSAAVTKNIYVKHVTSGGIILLNAFVYNLSNLGGCLLPGSMIKTPTGKRAIEDIETGQKVIAYNEQTKKQVEATVLDKAPHKADFYYKINDLKLTSGHPVWANEKWACVDPIEYKRECVAYGHTLDLKPEKLELGDTLYGGEKLKTIELVEEPTEVWNIIIEDVHTYIADDILVHNGGGGGGGKCLTPAMLPKGLQIGDEIDSPQGKTKVVDIIYKQREGYYILEDELEITNDHPILIDGEWILAEEYAGKKEYIEEQTEVVYVETENELLTVKGWTVGGKY